MCIRDRWSDMKKILLFSDYKVIYEITYKIIEEMCIRDRINFDIGIFIPTTIRWKEIVCSITVHFSYIISQVSANLLSICMQDVYKRQ